MVSNSLSIWHSKSAKRKKNNAHNNLRFIKNSIASQHLVNQSITLLYFIRGMNMAKKAN